MSFKKVTDSVTDGMYIIGSSDKNRYPEGFQYVVGGTIYTVREDVTKDAGSEMRRVVTSNGSTEIMTLESIDLDLKEPDARIQEDCIPKKADASQPQPEEQKNTEKNEIKGEKDEFEGLDW